MPVQLGSVPFAPAFAGWRPSPQQAPAYQPRALAQAQRRPQLGQAASVAKGADVLFSLLTGAGALTIGLVAMTVGIGSSTTTETKEGTVTVEKTVFKRSGTWQWLGGFTALLGIATILFNVSKVSRFTEMATVSTTPTAQP